MIWYRVQAYGDSPADKIGKGNLREVFSKC